MKTVGRDKQIYLIGSGGAMMDDVKMISLSFTSFHGFTIEEARQYYVEIAEKYLLLINENEKLRPYLHNYPFDFHNIQFDIGFHDVETRKWSKDSVAFVFCSRKDGIIFYDIYDHEKDKLIDVYEEPYEEALKIVKETGVLDPKPKEIVQEKRSFRKKIKSERKLLPSEKKLLNN